MKQKLCLGNCYALTKHKLHQLNIRNFSLLAVLTIMCLYTRGLRLVQKLPARSLGILLLCLMTAVSGTNAQSKQPNVKMIRVGDSIPDTFYHMTHHAVDARTGEGQVMKLADYRDKLIILDFWASWCKACLHSINKFDTLKHDFPHEQYVVIPVTTETKSQSARTMSRLKWDLISIVGDTILGQYFPHQAIPHQVWMVNDRVVAMPNYYYSTRQNIEKAIAGKQLPLVNNIQDLKFNSSSFAVNPKARLDVSGHGDIIGYLEGYQWERATYFQRNDSTFLYVINMPWKSLYAAAFEEEIFPLFRRTPDAIDWRIDKALKEKLTNKPEFDLTGDLIAMDKRRNAWNRQNRFGYLLRVRGLVGEQYMKKLLQEDLNKYFKSRLGITASINATKVVRYAVLRLTKPKNSVECILTPMGDGQSIQHTADSSIYRKYPFSLHFRLYVKRALKRCSDIDLDLFSLVDSTGIPNSFMASFSFPRLEKIDSFNALQNELERYGMIIDIEEKAIPQLVLED
ncbi:TlpA family protein disulfide reductase [Parapedobacter sp.]